MKFTVLSQSSVWFCDPDGMPNRSAIGASSGSASLSGGVRPTVTWMLADDVLLIEFAARPVALSVTVRYWTGPEYVFDAYVAGPSGKVSLQVAPPQTAILVGLPRDADVRPTLTRPWE